MQYVTEKWGSQTKIIKSVEDLCPIFEKGGKITHIN